MDNVSAKCERDKQKTMQDYRDRLLSKKCEIELELCELEGRMQQLQRRHEKNSASLWRWLPSKKQLIQQDTMTLEEWEEKKQLKRRLLGSINQKLRAMP